MILKGDNNKGCINKYLLYEEKQTCNNLGPTSPKYINTF